MPGGAAEVLTARVLRAWAASAAEQLSVRRTALDALNVFPVPDSDTGTNLALTLAEGVDALAALAPDAPADAVADALARGVLLGARGNSGVIVGQYLAALVGARATGADGLAAALDGASGAARRAVARPVEGTVLSVAAAVADGARTAGPGAAPDEVLEAGLAAGVVELERSPARLPALARAGVVDAGGWGLLLVLEALLGVLTGRRASGQGGAPTDPARADGAPVAPGPDAGPVPAPGPPTTSGRHAADGGAFEVMYVLDRAVRAGGPSDDDDVAAALRTALGALGGSVAVSHTAGLWQAHVHTDDPLAVLELAPPAGTVAAQRRIRHLASQSGVHGAHRPAVGLVAVTRAPALVPDLAAAGAVVVLVDADRAAGPELARAVADTGAGTVVVLAVDGTAVPVVAAGGQTVDVVAGLEEVQLAVGVATFATGAGADEIAATVRGVRTASARVGGPDDAGPVLDAARTVLLPGTSLLTVLTPGGPGRGAGPLRQALADAHPGVEVVVLPGTLPGDRVLLGAE